MEPPDLRDDVYAYACVIYELLSGRHVFGGKSACEARDAKMTVQPLPMLSKAQYKTLCQALAFNRAERTGSIEEVIDGLKVQDVPQRSRSVLIGVALLGVVLAAAGWWALKTLRMPDEDQAFVNSLLQTNAEVPDAVDPDEIKLLLDQGNDYLATARTHFDPAILSEGVSTAYGAYRAVLRLDPANRPAAEHILEIVKLYESRAQALRDENQFKRASTLIGYALKIDPNRTSLKELQDEIAPKVMTETASAP
jgi:serine/threonine protein kinase